MRRVLPAAALLGALALAGSAAAAPPPPVPFVHGTVVGGNHPIRMLTSVTPPVALFGDTVKATLIAFTDRKWIDPSQLRPLVSFALYKPIAPPTTQERDHGRLVITQWTWTLRCATVKCVPIAPPSDTEHVFHFPAAQIEYLDNDGKVAWTADARFPAVKVYSDLTPAIVAFVMNNHRPKWQYQLTPAAVSYGISPALVFWIAVLIAAICAAAALAIATRWVIRLRSPAPIRAGIQVSSLEQALALFFWAGRHGDETLQRKALERVAAELPIDVSDLSDVTRELAWSAEIPEEDEVEAISARAGVPAHHQNGAGE